MPESIVLNGVGIAKGNSGGGFQYYQILGKDETEQQFLTTFAVKMCYTDSTEKTFKRMFPVPAPEPVVNETCKEIEEAIVENAKELSDAVDTAVVKAYTEAFTEKKELSDYEKLLLED